MRYYYLRDGKNIQKRKDGTFTKGNPLVLIASEVDRLSSTIRYAIAAVHPKDNFVRAKAIHIVKERLAKKPIVLQGLPKGGYEILRKIMSDLFANDEHTVSRRVRKLALNWLEQAREVKQVS